jgi:hypothetical protein
MHLDCIDESNAPLSRQNPSTIAPRSVRPHGSDRAKLACQNCRRDNKKCEDQRPCSRCVARSENCVHVGRGPKLVKLRCEGCRLDNKKCEDVRPCKHCTDLGKQCVNVMRKGKGHGTRVKAACTCCRRDKIRCDGVRPCSACTRKGYQCIDRACRSCSQKGKDSECTHHAVAHDNGGSDQGGENSEAFVSQSGSDLASPNKDQERYNLNAHASSSSHHIQHHQPLHHLHQLPPSYNLPHFYYHSQAMGRHDQLAPIMTNQIYTPDDRAGYFTSIDPHIDASPSQVMMGPDQNVDVINSNTLSSHMINGR